MNVEEYALMAKVEDRHWWYAGLRRHIALVWRRFGHGQAGRALDVGCGTGANMASLPAALVATGVDLSPHALEHCRHRELPRLAQADARQLPFPDGHFDFALLMDVLYHREVPDKVGTLRELGRVLKPSGLLCLNVPAYQWLYSSHDRIIHTDRRFVRGEIVSMLHEAGFDCLWATYWNTALFPPIVLVRLWRKLFPLEGSDLTDEPSAIMSRIFGLALTLERAALRIMPLPFGLSILAVARPVAEDHKKLP